MPKPLTVWITMNWKILKEMGIPDDLTCLLRNLYAGQEAVVRTGHGTTDWCQIGKGVRKGCVLSPCLFNLYAEYIMRNAGLEETQAGLKIAGRNFSNLRYAVEKAMATHPSTLAWKIPWAEEPGRLQSMGSRWVGHDWVTSLSFFTFMHWRRKWQPTPVFLPREFQGWGAWWAGISGVAQSQTRLKRLSSSSSKYADDTTLMAESEEELKSVLMKVKEESEKVGLKLNIQKTKIMASGPITSWQIDGETGETVAVFIFLGSKITANGDCSREIKRRLLLGRKVMTNLDSILKSRDITLSTKVCLVKAIVFPVVLYGCESWTTKKAERQSINALELWCWRRLLRVPWAARRSNQSILKEISPGCSLEGLILKLKLQYFGHLMWRADLFEKTQMLGKIEGRRRRGQQRMR